MTADVARERLLGEVLEDSALVRAVDHIAPPHGASSSTRSVIVGQVWAARGRPRSHRTTPPRGPHGGAEEALNGRGRDNLRFRNLRLRRLAPGMSTSPTPPPRRRSAPRSPASSPSVKPRLRGWLHAGMFPVALVGGLVLVLVSQPGSVRTASIIFTISAALLFGVSAVYHRGTWGPKMSGLLKRFDHSNIYLIIAGTYTPFARDPAARRPGAAAAVGHLGRRRRRGALPRLLGQRAALALHRALPRARLGRGLLRRAVLAPGRPARRLAHRRSAACSTPPAASSTARSGPTRGRGGSASTRSSTPSRSAASSPTSRP